MKPSKNATLVMDALESAFAVVGNQINEANQKQMTAEQRAITAEAQYMQHQGAVNEKVTGAYKAGYEAGRASVLPTNVNPEGGNTPRLTLNNP